MDNKGPMAAALITVQIVILCAVSIPWFHDNAPLDAHPEKIHRANTSMRSYAQEIGPNVLYEISTTDGIQVKYGMEEFSMSGYIGTLVAQEGITVTSDGKTLTACYNMSAKPCSSVSYDGSSFKVNGMSVSAAWGYVAVKNIKTDYAFYDVGSDARVNGDGNISVISYDEKTHTYQMSKGKMSEFVGKSNPQTIYVNGSSYSGVQTVVAEKKGGTYSITEGHVKVY